MNVPSETFGEFFKTLRLKTGLTLRKFCEKHNFDHSNISRMERGLTPPPVILEKIEQYALALEIEPFSNDWYYFFDSAAVGTGRIPADMMSNEEIIKNMPLLFRMMRKESITEEKINAMLQVVGKA